MQRGISPPSEEAGPIPGTSAAGMAAQGLVGHDADDAANDGRKAKRELSQSKRAAQNRAAQVSRNFTFPQVMLSLISVTIWNPLGTTRGGWLSFGTPPLEEDVMAPEFAARLVVSDM